MGFRIALCNEAVRALPFAAPCEFARACGHDGIEATETTGRKDPPA